MAFNLEQFKKDLSLLDISLSENQINQFLQYYDILVEWNSFMNLTAITEFNEVLKKHFIDSLSLVKANPILKENGMDIYTSSLSIIDIGTGAGFPGIPLKIAFPNLHITLLDSLGKRVKFLNEVIQKLNLKDINAIHGRAEDFAKPGELREKFDLCVSRAVANLSSLSEYCIPYVKVHGFFIPYKSEKIVEEMETANHAIFLLGGKVLNQVSFHLPDCDLYRNLVVIEKKNSTSKKYPRKAGLPKKEPLQ